MSRSTRASLLLVLTFGWVHAATGQETAPPIVDASAPSPRAVLEVAFTNRYEVDTISNLELIMRNRSGQERRRVFNTVSKLIDSRLHSIGRLVEPPYLRGMTIMVVEADEREHDTFVFLPSIGRTRRVTTAQRGDAFLGSDLTYEDFERQYPEDYEAAFLASGDVAGEACWLVRATPVRQRSYDHVVFAVSKRDHAILESRYFKRDAELPYRTIESPRESMVRGAGHILPKHVLVTNNVRGTSTEVRLHHLEIAPEIDDRVFSVRTLEQEKRLPRTPEAEKATD